MLKKALSTVLTVFFLLQIVAPIPVAYAADETEPSISVDLLENNNGNPGVPISAGKELGAGQHLYFALVAHYANTSRELEAGYLEIAITVPDRIILDTMPIASSGFTISGPEPDGFGNNVYIIENRIKSEGTTADYSVYLPFCAADNITSIEDLEITVTYSLNGFEQTGEDLSLPGIRVIPALEMKADKSADKVLVATGDSDASMVIYETTLSNERYLQPTEITLVDTLPEYAVLVSDTPAYGWQATYYDSNNAVITDLANDAERVRVIVWTPTEAAPEHGENATVSVTSVIYSKEITGDNADKEIPQINSIDATYTYTQGSYPPIVQTEQIDCEITLRNPKFNWKLDKTRNKDLVSVGEEIEFSISICNQGDVLPDDDVVVKDVLPEGMTFVGVSSLADFVMEYEYEDETRTVTFILDYELLSSIDGWKKIADIKVTLEPYSESVYLQREFINTVTAELTAGDRTDNPTASVEFTAMAQFLKWNAKKEISSATPVYEEESLLYYTAALGSEVVEYTVYLNKEGDIDGTSIMLYDQLASNARLVGVKTPGGTAFTLSDNAYTDGVNKVTVDSNKITMELYPGLSKDSEFHEVLILQVLFVDWSNNSEWKAPYDSSMNVAKNYVNNTITGEVVFDDPDVDGSSKTVVIARPDNSELYLQPAITKSRVGSEIVYSPNGTFSFTIGGFTNKTGAAIPVIITDELDSGSSQNFYISNVIAPQWSAGAPSYTLEYKRSDGETWYPAASVPAMLSAGNAGLTDDPATSVHIIAVRWVYASVPDSAYISTPGRVETKLVQPVRTDEESKVADVKNNAGITLPADPVYAPGGEKITYKDTRFGSATTKVSWPGTGGGGEPSPFISFDKEYLNSGETIYNRPTIDNPNSSTLEFKLTVTAEGRSDGDVKGVLNVFDKLPYQFSFLEGSSDGYDIDVVKYTAPGVTATVPSYTVDVNTIPSNNPGDNSFGQDYQLMCITFEGDAALDGIILESGEWLEIIVRAVPNDGIKTVARSQNVRNMGWISSSRFFYSSRSESPAIWARAATESDPYSHSSGDAPYYFIDDNLNLALNPHYSDLITIAQRRPVVGLSKTVDPYGPRESRENDTATFILTVTNSAKQDDCMDLEDLYVFDFLPSEAFEFLGEPSVRFYVFGEDDEVGDLGLAVPSGITGEISITENIDITGTGHIADRLSIKYPLLKAGQKLVIAIDCKAVRDTTGWEIGKRELFNNYGILYVPEINDINDYSAALEGSSWVPLDNFNWYGNLGAADGFMGLPVSNTSPIMRALLVTSIVRETSYLAFSKSHSEPSHTAYFSGQDTVTGQNFIRFSLELQNRAEGSASRELAGFTISDILPVGLTYRPGSTVISVELPADAEPTLEDQIKSVAPKYQSGNADYAAKGVVWHLVWDFSSITLPVGAKVTVQYIADIYGGGPLEANEFTNRAMVIPVGNEQDYFTKLERDLTVTNTVYNVADKDSEDGTNWNLDAENKNDELGILAQDSVEILSRKPRLDLDKIVPGTNGSATVISEYNQLTKYRITLTQQDHNLTEPIDIKDIALYDFLPKGVLFVEGSLRVYIAGQETINFTHSITRPVKPVDLEGYENYSRLSVSFPGHTGTLRRGEAIVIEFSVSPTNAAAPGVNTNRAYAAVASNFYPVGTYETEEAAIWPGVNSSNKGLDWNGDGYRNKVGLYAENRQLYLTISNSIMLDKYIRGDLDPTYLNFASTAEVVRGGKGRYQLSIMNNDQGGSMSEIAFVDVLPYVGDTMLLSNTARNSQWRAYLASTDFECVVRKVDEYTIWPDPGVPDLTIYYNTKPDVIVRDATGRLSVRAVDFAADGWTDTPPTDLNTVYAIGVEPTDPDWTLPPGWELSLYVPFSVPADSIAGQYAKGSFALSAIVAGYRAFSGESPVVTARVIEPDLGMAQISGQVWVDNDEDGIRNFAKGDLGLNGAIVRLYKNGIFADSAVTTGSGDKAGVYSFYINEDEITGNTYTMKLILPGGYEISPDSDIIMDGIEPGYARYSATTSDYVNVGVIDLTAAPLDGVIHHAPNIDFGLIKEIDSAHFTISGRVWLDTRSDGVLDTDEAGLNDKLVQLYMLKDKNGSFAPGDSLSAKATYVRSATTATINDVTGYYAFNNLDPNQKYVLVFLDGQHSPFTLATVPSSGDNINLARTSAGVWYIAPTSPGVGDTSVEKQNCGLHTTDAATLLPYSSTITGRVYMDTIKNYTDDSSEVSATATRVTLMRLNDEDTNEWETVSSQTTASYSFAGISTPGKYKLVFELGKGEMFVQDNGAGVTTGTDVLPGSSEQKAELISARYIVIDNNDPRNDSNAHVSSVPAYEFTTDVTPFIVLRKSPDSGTPSIYHKAPNNTIEFTLVVKNDSTNSTAPVTGKLNVVDVLPDGLELDTAVTPRYVITSESVTELTVWGDKPAITYDGITLTWSFGAAGSSDEILEPGQSLYIKFTAKATGEIYDESVTNLAYAASSNPFYVDYDGTSNYKLATGDDEDKDNDTDTGYYFITDANDGSLNSNHSVPVKIKERKPDVTIAKTEVPPDSRINSRYVKGETLGFIVTVTNSAHNTDNGDNVIVNIYDLLPAGLEFDEDTPSDWVVVNDSGGRLLKIPNVSLNVGESRSFTIPVTVTSTFSALGSQETLTNTAFASVKPQTAPPSTFYAKNQIYSAPTTTVNTYLTGITGALSNMNGEDGNTPVISAATSVYAYFKVPHIMVGKSADKALGSPYSVLDGDDNIVTYTVRVDNVSYDYGANANGNAPLYGFTLSDMLPENMTYIPGSAMLAKNGGVAAAFNPTDVSDYVTWTFGDETTQTLDVGEYYTLTFKLKIDKTWTGDGINNSHIITNNVIAVPMLGDSSGNKGFARVSGGVRTGYINSANQVTGTLEYEGAVTDWNGNDTDNEPGVKASCGINAEFRRPRFSFGKTSSGSFKLDNIMHGDAPSTFTLTFKLWNHELVDDDYNLSALTIYDYLPKGMEVDVTGIVVTNNGVPLDSTEFGFTQAAGYTAISSDDYRKLTFTFPGGTLVKGNSITITYPVAITNAGGVGAKVNRAFADVGLDGDEFYTTNDAGVVQPKVSESTTPWNAAGIPIEWDGNGGTDIYGLFAKAQVSVVNRGPLEVIKEVSADGETYGDTANVPAGGGAFYKFTIRNYTGSDYTAGSFAVVDVLPREDFKVYLSRPIAAPAGVTVWYNTFSNVTAGSTTFNAANGWQNTAPVNLTEVTAVAFVGSAGYSLKSAATPGDGYIFTITFAVTVDNGATGSVSADNTFTIAGNTTEPATIILAASSGGGVISGTLELEVPQSQSGVPLNYLPLDGVTVELYKSDGTLVTSRVTSNNGKYSFDGLISGDDYYVVFVTTDYDFVGEPVDERENYPKHGLNDSGGLPQTGFITADSEPIIDVNCIVTGKISANSKTLTGFVFIDTNENTVMDDSEAMYNKLMEDEITVTLYKGNDPVGTTVQTVGGYYYFPGLDYMYSGTYTLEFESAAGLTPTGISNNEFGNKVSVSGSGKWTAELTLNAAPVTNLNCGLKVTDADEVPIANISTTISGGIFLDVNDNGTQDLEEVLFTDAPVTVTLQRWDSASTAWIDAASVSVNSGGGSMTGMFEFTGIYFPGTYRLYYELTPGYLFVDDEGSPVVPNLTIVSGSTNLEAAADKGEKNGNGGEVTISVVNTETTPAVYVKNVGINEWSDKYLPSPLLVFTKSPAAAASIASHAPGNGIDFTLELLSRGKAISGSFNIVDELPLGLTYESNSAKYTLYDEDNDPVSGKTDIGLEPAITGQRLVWSFDNTSLDMDAGYTLVIEFSAYANGSVYLPGDANNGKPNLAYVTAEQLFLTDAPADANYGEAYEDTGNRDGDGNTGFYYIKDPAATGDSSSNRNYSGNITIYRNEPLITLTKIADNTSIKQSDTTQNEVVYTITVKNNETIAHQHLSGLTLYDILPSGLVYKSHEAELNGNPVALTFTNTGNVVIGAATVTLLKFSGIALDVGSELVITITATSDPALCLDADETENLTNFAYLDMGVNFIENDFDDGSGIGANTVTEDELAALVGGSSSSWTGNADSDERRGVYDSFEIQVENTQPQLSLSKDLATQLDYYSGASAANNRIDYILTLENADETYSDTLTDYSVVDLLADGISYVQGSSAVKIGGSTVDVIPEVKTVGGDNRIVWSFSGDTVALLKGKKLEISYAVTISSGFTPDSFTNTAVAIPSQQDAFTATDSSALDMEYLDSWNDNGIDGENGITASCGVDIQHVKPRLSFEKTAAIADETKTVLGFMDMALFELCLTNTRHELTGELTVQDLVIGDILRDGLTPIPGSVKAELFRNGNAIPIDVIITMSATSPIIIDGDGYQQFTFDLSANADTLKLGAGDRLVVSYEALAVIDTGTGTKENHAFAMPNQDYYMVSPSSADTPLTLTSEADCDLHGETADWDGDNDTVTNGIYSGASITITENDELALELRIKGTGTTYGEQADSYKSGPASYELTARNLTSLTQNTSTILALPRKSADCAFSVYLSEALTAPSGVEVWYSTASGVTADSDPNDSALWSATAPGDLSQVTAVMFKAALDSYTELADSYFTVTIPCVVAGNAETGSSVESVSRIVSSTGKESSSSIVKLNITGTPTNTVSGQVFLETASINGVFDPGEAYINAVTVELIGCDEFGANEVTLGSVITAGTGMNAGLYAFDSLDGAQYYKLRFTLPNGYSFTVERDVGGNPEVPITGLGVNTDCDIDTSLTIGETAPFRGADKIINAAATVEMQAGVPQSGTISGAYWLDTNGNLKNDVTYSGTEPGFNGYLVYLYKNVNSSNSDFAAVDIAALVSSGDLQLIATTRTFAYSTGIMTEYGEEMICNGYYSFSGVDMDNDYLLVFEPPHSMSAGGITAGYELIADITADPDSDSAAKTTGLNSKTVYFTTLSSGSFDTLTGLAFSSCGVKLDMQGQGQGDIDTLTDDVLDGLTDDEKDLLNEMFSMYGFRISGTVTVKNSSAGFGGVTVELWLLDDAGERSEKKGETVTEEDGGFSFPPMLAAGTYQLVLTSKDAYNFVLGDYTLGVSGIGAQSKNLMSVTSMGLSDGGVYDIYVINTEFTVERIDSAVPDMAGGLGKQNTEESEEPEDSGTHVRPDDSGRETTVSLGGDDHIKYIYGYPDETIRPEQYITRAEVAQVVYNLTKRLSDVNPTASGSVFTDVGKNEWYAVAVEYAYGINAMTGYPDGSFKPNESISREELVAVLSRFFTMKSEGNVSFNDIDPESWSFKYILSADAMGWMDGYPDGGFHPNDPTKRVEFAKIMNRALYREILFEDIPQIAKDLMLPDLSEDHWGYAELIEAFYFHDYTRKTNIGRPEIWHAIYDNAEDYFARIPLVNMLAQQDAILPDKERYLPPGNNKNA